MGWIGMLLSMQGISKSFGGVPALRTASLEIAAGEVMALVGQNGAGKSTLIKILTGVYQRDEGAIHFDGRDIDFASPSESQAVGIATIYQEINLAPQRSVAENIYLSREPRRYGFLDRRAMREGAKAVLKTFKLEIDVDLPVAHFNAATRQMVSIARAVTQNARLLIMDEPTSSLDEREVAVLFETIRTLKQNGVAVVFIGHRLDELYAICDRVTIMRDGQTVAVGAMRDTPKMELVRHMLGRELAAFEALSRDTDANAERPIRLALEGAGSGLRVRNVDLSIREGEISGLAGLLGSGRTETARIIFGLDRLERGTMRFDGKLRSYSEPAAAIADGIGLVSEDRKVDGIVPDMSIRENMTLAASKAQQGRDRRSRAPERDRGTLHQGARRQMRLTGPTDQGALRRQSAKGVAGALALHRAPGSHRRRADTRHRYRRKDRDPPSAEEAGR